MIRPGPSCYRDFVQADILDRRPDNRETTGLRGEHIDLIGPLSHVTKEALNGIGRLNVAVHRLRKGVKRKAGALRPPSGCAPLRDSVEHTSL